MRRFTFFALAILLMAVSFPAYGFHRETLYKSKIQGFRPEETIDLEQGYVFTAADRFLDLDDGETTSFLFQNKTDTATAYINAIDINSTGEGLVDIYDSFTIRDTGTELFSENLNLGFNAGSAMTVSKNASVNNFDTSTQLLEAVMPGGSSAPNRSFGGNLNTRLIVVTPGDNFVVVVENNSGSIDANYSINLIWTERK